MDFCMQVNALDFVANIIAFERLRIFFSSSRIVGGQDGVQCLNHVERYDPKENKWSKVKCN